MFKSARGQRLPRAGRVALPESWLGDALTNPRNRHRQRLLGQHTLGFGRGQRQQQFKIFPIAERVLKRRHTIATLCGESLGIGGDGDF